MKRFARYFTVFIFVIFRSVLAQTLVSGEISGTWHPGTYNVIANCTVPSGQVLTIEPGVTVIIGRGLEIDVFGQLFAVGKQDQRIIIKAPNDTTYWNRIYIAYSGKTSRVEYCDITNAQAAIVLHVVGVNATMNAEIINCKISNCKIAGIYGESEGYYTGFPYSPLEPSLNPTIMKCVFDLCASGCKFYILGNSRSTGNLGGQVIGSGGASPIITNNVFKNISSAALEMINGNLPRKSTPVFVNNTVVNANKGIFASAPYDAVIKNNIFFGIINSGIERTGTSSSLVGYNCFFEKNSKNFVGYPQTFGDIVMQNRNGTPSDVAFNIFVNPLFSNSTSFRLAQSSPCIDAGDATRSFNDGCLPLAQGTEVNDIGAYGGPGVCDFFTQVENVNSALLVNYSLDQNYPNPFNPVTTIHYVIPKSDYVILKVYNLLGREIETLVNEKQSAGGYKIRWNPVDFPSGVYVYRIQAGKFSSTRKLVFLK